jgi:hypothetical protein
MDTIVGAITTLGIGVVIVAVIYNLTSNSGGSTLVQAGQTSYTTTLNDLFK